MRNWALESTKGGRLREASMVMALGEIEKKVKTSLSLGEYLEEWKQRV